MTAPTTSHAMTRETSRPAADRAARPAGPPAG